MDKIESLRREILNKVAEYYHLVHQPKQEAAFEPGKTRINYAGRTFDDAEMTALVDSALEFWLTSGRCTKEFEARLAEFIGVRFALMVNSGSSANLLAVSALTSPLLGKRRLRRGDEVITVACAFPTTVAPVIQCGAIPVFVDVEADTVNISPAQIEAAASPRTRAVIAAHTLGNPFNLNAVKKLCRERGWWLIEDNCDALGSLYDGKPTGGHGDIGTSSFYPPHHLTTGEGGAVYTDDPLLKKIMLSMRDWGRDCWCASGVDNTCGCRFTRKFGSLPIGYDHKYVYSHFGYNLKATDLQAAIGCVQLGKLPEFVRMRRHNFDRLFDGLKTVDGLDLFVHYPESEPAWFGFLMTLNGRAKFTRNQLAEFLESRNIQTRNLFAGNLLRHPCFESLRENVDYRVAAPLVNTERIMNDALWIGVYPGMSDAKLDYMIESVKAGAAELSR